MRFTLTCSVLASFFLGTALRYASASRNGENLKALFMQLAGIFVLELLLIFRIQLIRIELVDNEVRYIGFFKLRRFRCSDFSSPDALMRNIPAVYGGWERWKDARRWIETNVAEPETFPAPLRSKN